MRSKTPEYRSVYEKQLLQKNPEYARRQRANSRKWAKEHLVEKSYYDWAYHIKQKYGLTVVAYANILEMQGGGCALCGKGPVKNKLPVDHDHVTGRIRGILCTPCNRALGILEHNITKVVAYLQADDVRVSSGASSTTQGSTRQQS